MMTDDFLLGLVAGACLVPVAVAVTRHRWRTRLYRARCRWRLHTITGGRLAA